MCEELAIVGYGDYAGWFYLPNNCASCNAIYDGSVGRKGMRWIILRECRTWTLFNMCPKCVSIVNRDYRKEFSGVDYTDVSDEESDKVWLNECYYFMKKS